MNILVIGNGFDLAHGLPTTYKDFLAFTDEFIKFEKSYLNGLYVFSDETRKFEEYLYELIITRRDVGQDKDAENLINELKDLIQDNMWLKHFHEVRIKQGWVDFESEISRIIQTLDSVRLQILAGKERGELVTSILKPQRDVLQEFSVDNTAIESLTFVNKTKERLEKDLNRLIRCLEIYLCDYIGNIKIEKKHPDIEAINADYVLSFNYTNTYERVYEDKTIKSIEYDYIHGKAELFHDIESCNMVIGIDEYLDDYRKDKDNEFIQFKKFYQRIYKKTGCKYIDWLKEYGYISEMKLDGYEPIINIYIFGHSLDETDKDILEKLIMNESAKTTIYYHDKKTLGSQIANLVKVIRQDNLIEKVHGEDATIEFIQQQE